MSTPSGGHAVHLTGSGREQKIAGLGGGGKIQQPPKHQPQSVGNGSVHQQLTGNVQTHGATHIHSHTELDPRVLGGHHGPPPKVDATGIMDAWTRMAPQYASQAAHSPLEPQFISSSPAAYYHAPVSPYGATYAGLGNESTHGGASWSNGTDVASYFGYAGPTSAEFHHPESMSIPGLFGNGYPAGTYGAPSNFGYSPFTATHTAPGPAVSQDYTGWGATTAHDLVDRGAHQKNPYGDYYSYDLMSATPNIIGPPGAPLEMGGAPMTINCESLKSLGNQMETLSMVQGIIFSHESSEPEHQVEESRPVETCDATFETESEPLHKADDMDELNARHSQQNSTEKKQNDVHSNRNAQASVEATDNLLTTTVPPSNTVTASSRVASPKKSGSHYSVENNNNNNNDEVTITEEEFVQSRTLTSSHSSNTMCDSSSTDIQPTGLAKEDKKNPEDTVNQVESSHIEYTDLGSEKQTAAVKMSNWSCIEEEVKDWSASPPPEPLSHSSESNDLSPNQEKQNIPTLSEQASTHLLQDLISKNNYNPTNFEGSVEGARFFVIKSYSEDDVHRSIKYSIWCSTEHGNKKLDQAFRHQKNSGERAIYLFYSVNGSGHFCGMAQMTSSVDYDTLTGVWAQDKWKGKFNVKWIYVKDIPNSELRHIRLENNENKPVTNSRDTQEIPIEKGRQVLDIMHKYRHETSLFDDFVYYEDMEHKRETERENHQASVQTCTSNVAKDRSSPSSEVRTALRVPPKRKDHVDDIREGHSSNGNHRDNHHLKDYYHRDTRDRTDSRNSAALGGNNRPFGGASGSNAGSYNHNHRDGNNRGFGYREEDRGNYIGRSFTNFRRNADRDRDYSRDGSERMFFSNRDNTSRNYTAPWRF